MPFVLPPGTGGGGFGIGGVVPDEPSLPFPGTEGEIWITADNGHGWLWDGTVWVDIGPIALAPNFTSTTATGAPGTNASVTVTGTPPDFNLHFTIPRGDVGPGVAPGGQTGWHLVKRSNTNYDTEWQKTEHVHTQAAPASTWAIGHSLAQRYVQVTV